MKKKLDDYLHKNGTNSARTKMKEAMRRKIETLMKKERNLDGRLKLAFEKKLEKIKNELATGVSAFDSPLNSPG